MRMRLLMKEIAGRKRSLLGTWRVDGEALLGDVTGAEAVVQWAGRAGDGDLNALTVQINHGVHLWKRQTDILVGSAASPRPCFLLKRTSTCWQPRAGDALIHAVDVIMEVAVGCAHHADPRACGQGVQVTAVVVAHCVAILHDGRSTGGENK